MFLNVFLLVLFMVKVTVSDNNSIDSDYFLPIRKGSMKHVHPRRHSFRIIIRSVERPSKEDFDNQFAWICSSLGFFEPIDRDKNAAAILREIILAGDKRGLTSTELAERIGMSRGSTINHLNNLLRSGLLEKNGKYYSIRNRSMEKTIEEIEEDVERIFLRLKKIASNIDRQFID